MSVRLQIKRLRHAQDLELPSYATEGAAGLDVRAAEERMLQPGETALVPTGFALQIPAGFEVQMRPRSGLAAKHGLTLLNAPGTIDCDFRGEVNVILTNLGHEPYFVQRGERIAQMVVAPVVRAEFDEVEVLGETERGGGGFGHTGKL